MRAALAAAQKEPIDIARLCDLQSNLKTLCALSIDTAKEANADDDERDYENVQNLLAFENEELLKKAQAKQRDSFATKSQLISAMDRCAESAGQGILKQPLKPKKVIIVTERGSELASKPMDRMDISLLLLRLKQGDPAIFESFARKLADGMERGTDPKSRTAFLQSIESTFHFFFHDRQSQHEIELLTKVIEVLIEREV
jgi:hypothetical protein